MRLQELRLAKGFKTQESFASATGLSQSFIAQVEAGKKWPSLRTLRVMAKTLGCTIDEIVEEKTEG